MTEAAEKSDRTWLYIGLAFCALWGVYLAFFNGRMAPEHLGPSLPADYSWSLKAPDGSPVSLAEYRGRPIVLNIWATWCPPCRAEMPSLVRLAANPKVKGVAFLCVTGEPPGPTVQDYASKSMNGLTVLHASDVPAVFATEGIPATFLISPEGQIVDSVVGAEDWDTPKFVSLLEGLLKKVPAGADSPRP